MFSNRVAQMEDPDNFVINVINDKMYIFMLNIAMKKRRKKMDGYS